MNPIAFTDVFLEGRHLGWAATVATPTIKNLFFFGQKNCDENDLHMRFPDLQFYRAKQVHGNTAIEAPLSPRSSGPPEADALWTTANNVACLVMTADCLPVLVSNPNFVAAIHAGWRGILNRIAFLTLEPLLQRYRFLQNTIVCIGPHIQATHFEVREDVYEQFKGHPDFIIHSHAQPHPTEPKKYRIALKSILHRQLTMLGLPQAAFSFLDFNTMADPRLASYRRDGISNNRNLSFVARLAQNDSII